MKIIISPTKQMTQEIDAFLPISHPIFLSETESLLTELKKLSYDEAKTLWKCNDKLATDNFERVQVADLATSPTSAAIMSYKGLQYQYMAPDLLTEAGLLYLQEHLRILSGFYGILRPFDGIIPYRLEMQAPLAVKEASNLYQFWGRKLYETLDFESGPVINLASKEYAKALQPYLTETDQLIEISFVQFVEGKLKVKATLAKMARGQMVRYLAENQITTLKGLKAFDHPNYVYSEEHSTTDKLVFLDHD